MNAKLPLINIKPNDWNPNEMTKQEFAELKKEIQHLGRLPKKMILRGKEKGRYEIIDGEHSYKALLELNISELEPDWYEVVDVDDTEAKRQTYKRNLGGKNNPVKLGLMFAQALQETGMSNRKLAEQWEVSEGMIRNNLLYAEASKLRSDYANLALLTNDQVRIYLKIAEYAKPIADLWLAYGGEKDALLVLDDFGASYDKAKYDVMATFQKLSISIMEQNFYKVLSLKNKQESIRFESHPKFKAGNIENFKLEFNRARHLSEILSQMEKNFIWDEKGTREYMLEYLAIYYDRPYSVLDHWMQEIFSTIIRKVNDKFEFMLTPDEIKECVEVRTGTANFSQIKEKVKEMIKKKHNIPTFQLKESWEPLEDKLNRVDIENKAPDYIKESTRIPLKLKLIFLDIKFANEDIKKESWEIFSKYYFEKDFKNLNYFNVENVKDKIKTLVEEEKLKSNRMKAIKSLAIKSEQELAVMFVENLRPLTKGDKKFEEELVPKLVKTFSKEYLHLMVFLAGKYFEEMRWKQYFAPIVQEMNNILKREGQAK